MKDRRIQNIGDVCRLLAAAYPEAAAEQWDKVGLQVGMPTHPVTGLLICLDSSVAAVRKAEELRANLIIAHHPLIFKPLTKIDLQAHPGSIVSALCRSDISLYISHTNLDAAKGGLNDQLAYRLNLHDATPLDSPEEQPGAVGFKLVFFAPAGYEDTLLQACFASGAGVIDNYRGCSFRTSGTGTFLPGEGAKPFVGEVGQLNQEVENRVEVIAPATILPRVIQAMIAAHPYEAPAYDVYKLHSVDWESGLGRVGNLPQSIKIIDFIDDVKQAFGVDYLRIVGDAEVKIKRVAVCSGSGGSYVAKAKAAGADALITGDVGYHAARDAEQMGLAVIDVGHFVLEKVAMHDIANELRNKLEQLAPSIPVYEFMGEEDPFRVL